MPASPKAALPVVTFGDGVAFYNGGEQIHVVHVPPVLMQALLQISWPVVLAGSGTHGARLQQSALVAHWVPAGTHGVTAPSEPQRGMPRLSWWQVSNCPLLPAQQLVFALQLVPSSLQTAPAGEHELPLSQRPTGFDPSLRHITFEFSKSG